MRIKAKLSEGFRAPGIRLDNLQQWMADEADLDPVALIKTRLEWKNDRHVVDPSGDLLDPIFAPSPNLRADIVKDRNPKKLGTTRETQVEFGKIDQHEEIGATCAQSSFEQCVRAPDISQIPGQFHQTHAGQLGDIKKRLKLTPL